MKKKLLDVGLISILSISIVAMFFANEDTFARDVWCRFSNFCPTVIASHFNKIIYDLSVGSFVTVLFYYLVVRLPEHERKIRLRRGLDQQYRLFKLDCIATMLSIVESVYDAELPEKLLDQSSFRAYFSEPVSEDQERWHVFMNKIDEFHLRDLLTSMEIFRDEVLFVMNNLDIPEEDTYEFLKRLSNIIYRLKDSSIGYDEIKPLSRFLWEIFAGYNIISGYRKEDIINKMIEGM